MKAKNDLLTIGAALDTRVIVGRCGNGFYIQDKRTRYMSKIVSVPPKLANIVASFFDNPRVFPKETWLKIRVYVIQITALMVQIDIATSNPTEAKLKKAWIEQYARTEGLQ